MTPAGAKSKSSFAPPRASRPSACTQKPATTPQATSHNKFLVLAAQAILPVLFSASLFLPSASAQDNPIAVPNSQPLPPNQDANRQGGSIKVDVSLVVLHTTVLDDRGKFVDGLKGENFRVFEDKAEQKLSVFKREDVPVSMGLVIDNSGSMRDKRPRVNEAALTLVQASNPQDESFVVNFNDDYYLDLDKDFTSSIPELKEALERIDARGSTALYDAVIGSMDHLRKGRKDKKILLVVTDGEDNVSRNSLEKTLREIQKSNVVIYTIGLFSDEDKKNRKKAMRALKDISAASGGISYFPENVDDVHNICDQVARDIRNQYTLGYYPTNTKKDGTFRTVQVDIIPPRGRGKLSARTRNGYFAPGQAAASDSPVSTPSSTVASVSGQ
ncbi:MAG: VWA domain-containing protein [Acidobacteria bacterium]|nr:MAG: VWA domain-containing protein [Acidobacteriota bacterium]